MYTQIDPAYLSSVKEYYDKSQKWYTWFYSDKKSLGLHYGFWDKPDTKRSDALLNQYRVIQTLLEPKEGELILDAGCGVGGASFYLANNTKARFVGITLSDTQHRYAQKYLSSNGLKEKVSIERQNYFHTNFKDENFDKIFAIESFCYAYPDPLPLYKEMYRILKPRGKIVISDGVFNRKPQNKEEEKITEDYCNGFKLAAMITPEEITKALQKAGFKNVQYTNKTPEIRKSIVDIDRRSRFVGLLRILKYVKLVSNTEAENVLATSNQKRMYEDGLFGYGVFSAEK